MGIGIENNLISMGQRIAKHRMKSGVKLYHQRRPQQAIARWRSALRRLTNAEDRFITLGYMTQTCCDIGNYQQMLRYALQQMELANIQQDDFMKSEAFLNLAKAYERLADFGKAIGYGRASLQYGSVDRRTPGHSYLVVALSQLGLSQFQASLEAFKKAMDVANQYSDRLLELQVCVGLGALFTLLRDLSKATLFLRNALAILEDIAINELRAKYRSVVLYHLSVVLRRSGSLVDAKATCHEAMKLAQKTGSRSVYARCLCSMACICCYLGESEAKETLTRSWSRYQEAYRIMRQTKDRMGEVLVLGSMARSASECRNFYTGKCECQAIHLNKKCLEVAKLIGCKYAMMKCHLRLQELYNQLNDEDSEELAKRAVTSLTQEMQLFCNFCGQRYGLQDDSLQALRCSHIFHERCLQIYLAECLDPSCPKCQCKAVLKENLSVSTPSISSLIGRSQQPLPFSGGKLVRCTDLMAPRTVKSSEKEEVSLRCRLSVSLPHRNLKATPIDAESSQLLPSTLGSLPTNALPSSQEHDEPPELLVCNMDGTLPVSSVQKHSVEELHKCSPLLPREPDIIDV